MTQTYHSKSRVKRPTSDWLFPVLLFLLGFLNVAGGALQLDTIQKGPPAVPDEFTTMQYFITPLPIVLHIVAGIYFNLLGPVQFAPGIRRRWPRFHRWVGRFWVPAGILVGLTGLYMNQFYPAYGGVAKYVGIWVNSVGIIVSLIIALRAILSREVSRHRIWMMRAFAFGLGPATQRLFILPVFFIRGEVSDGLIGFIIWFGFSLNLAVVEWRLWRERRTNSNQPNSVLGEMA